jgi:predicted kinase
MNNVNYILSNIFNIFLNEFIDHVNYMNDCQQGESLINTSPYHQEGNVWTHTCCCFSNIYGVLESFPKINDNDIKLIALAVLWHDSGKPFSVFYNEKGNKTFKGHDQVGIKIMINEYNRIISAFQLSNEDFIKLLKMIQCHTVYYQLQNIQDIYGWLDYDEELFNLYKILTRCDGRGQIRHPSKTENAFDKTDLFDITFTGKPLSPKKFPRELVVTVGAPASGKDFLLRQKYGNGVAVASLDHCRFLSFYEANPDKCQNRTYADIYSEAWTWCNQNKIDLSARMFSVIRELFEKGETRVAISNTHMSRRSRKYIFEYARHFKVDVNCLCAIVDQKTLKDRDYLRGIEDVKEGKTVGDDVIDRMLGQFIIPTLGEGFNNIDVVINI